MAHPVMLSLVPTAEFVRRVNGQLYVQVLEAVWGTPFVGPGPEEGGLPIQECPRLRDELTGFLNTRLAFNAKITVKWLTHKMLQVFGDDFANTTPGTYWQSVSGNPALAITETAGRLQYSSTQSTSVAAMAFAGYASANWRIRTTSEFRARVTLRSALVGTGGVCCCA